MITMSNIWTEGIPSTSMCRIAGIVSQQMTIHERERLVKVMCDIQWRGGPDDEGILSPYDSIVTLGSRRLSFNDLSQAGHQPMNYGRRYSITFNGEIYNFQEIRQKLIQQGFSFNSQSDTEVVIAAYAAWGKDSFEMLEGMFAFAIHDHELNSVILVRDPSGIKPLYYFFDNDSLIFASEVKAIHAVSTHLKEEKNWQILLMAFGHLPEPFTQYEKVNSLAKGNFLTYQLDTNEIKSENYFRYTFNEASTSFSDPVNWVKSTIEKAVKNQLLADVPVGVFLSGGIDSSILSLLAGKAKGNDLHALSICFDEQHYSEERYQNLVYEKLTGAKHQFLLQKEEFQKHLPTVLDDMDVPSADGINTWFICKFTKEKGIKGVLSGIGADELFGGYPSFERMKKVELLKKMPNWLKSSTSLLPGKMANRISYLKLEEPVGTYLFLRGHFGIKEIASHLDSYEVEIRDILNGLCHEVVPDFSNQKSKAGWYEYNMYMQNQLLRDADAMSMAHGVEIRVPFLDHQLVKGVLSMPENQRFKEGIPKQLLVDAFKEILPEPIWNRKKMGFSFPFSEWLKNNEMVNDLMNKINQPNKNHIKDFESGKMSWSCFLILMLLRKNGKI